MTGGRIILPPTNPSLDANGKPVNGATLTYYENGTTMLVSIYSDIELTVPLANPLTSDAAGVFPQVWAPNGVGYSVKWSRTGLGDVTFDDIFPDLDSSAVGTFVSLNQSQVSLGSNVNTSFGNQGVGLIESAFTWTDSTTGAGTVATAYASLFGAVTFATPLNAITITNAYGLYLKDPVAGAHVTLTNKFALGVDSFQCVGALNYGGVTLANSVTGTGSMVLSTSPTFTGTANFNSAQAVSFSVGAGVVLLSSASTQLNISTPGVNEGGVIASIFGTHTSTPTSIFDVASSGANNTATGLQIQKHSSSGRSINAAGTINASGADYAEYERKADGCGDIAKGQIIGFDADGKLTDKWSATKSFGIKSTAPAYVGGDTWGSHEALGIDPVAHPAPVTRGENETDADWKKRSAEYETALAAFQAHRKKGAAAADAARMSFDRIAYSGKVPVNVTGANPGDYIIAIQDGDGIGGQIVTTPTFEQYRMAVGRVRNIGTDGRAIVAVIVH